jgi:NAD-dependent dihydropyrimidine dehydrogenase PreA subunit
MGRFIEVSLDANGLAPATAQALVRACPVDIFRLGAGGRLETHPEREDECILCGQCVTLAPKAVAVARAYGARRPVLASERDGDD